MDQKLGSLVILVSVFTVFIPLLIIIINKLVKFRPCNMSMSLCETFFFCLCYLCVFKNLNQNNIEEVEKC